ncbi:hypothetical protein C8Q79DRAFT_938054 [Trametes meyenii]|nr:hypothetical protein C8Q79DRAFT_938054 [Trametes meyenii]
MDPPSIKPQDATHLEGPAGEQNMALHPRDIYAILQAHLETSLAVDMYLLKLPNNPCEKLQRPESPPPRILHRFGSDGLWVYHVYTAEMVPHPYIGARGDVWIDTTPRTGRVWFLGATDVWTLWNHIGCKDDSAHASVASSGTRHPWISGVCLQFTGSDVTWHPHSSREEHRLTWEISCGQSVLYDDISPHYPAQSNKLVWRVSRSRRHFQPAPQLKETAWYTQQKAFTRVGNVILRPPPTRLALGDVTNKARPPIAASCASPAASTQGGSRCAGTALQVTIKCEEEPENLLKRSHEALQDESLASAPQSKRVKREWGDSALLPIQAGGASASTSGLTELLQGLRVPLAHRSEVLMRFGIFSLEDFRRLAYARPGKQEEMFQWLRMEGGFSLVETLSLRLGLKAFRDSRISLAAPSLQMLFAQVDPAMMSCLPVFDELGIALEHLTLLSELDSYSYGVFEWELETRGISRKVLGMLWNTLRTGRLRTFADWRRSDGA